MLRFVAVAFLALASGAVQDNCAGDDDGECKVQLSNDAPCKSCVAGDAQSCLPCREALSSFDTQACADAERSRPSGNSPQDYSPDEWGLEDLRAQKESESLRGEDGVKSSDRQNAFRTIYAGDVWNGGSGPGSRWTATEGARCALNALRETLDFRKLWDVCGDFQWMHGWLLKNADIEYQGADVVPELVAGLQKRYGRAGQPGKASWSFVEADVVCNDGGLPQANGYDVVLLREVLQHQPPKEVLQSLRCISQSGAQWLLVTYIPEWKLRLNEGRIITLASANLGLDKGLESLDKWRTHWYDLTQPPYSLPEPVWSVQDGGKALGLWKLPLDLPET